MQIPVFSSTKFIQILNNSRFTQSDVADHVGVSQSTVHNWYSGKKGCLPDANQIHLLVNLFGVELNAFYEMSDSILPPPEN